MINFLKDLFKLKAPEYNPARIEELNKQASYYGKIKIARFLLSTLGIGTLAYFGLKSDDNNKPKAEENTTAPAAVEDAVKKVENSAAPEIPTIDGLIADLGNRVFIYQSERSVEGNVKAELTEKLIGLLSKNRSIKVGDAMRVASAIDSVLSPPNTQITYQDALYKLNKLEVSAQVAPSR